MKEVLKRIGSIFVDILIVIHFVRRNLNLCIRTGNEIHVLTGRQCNDELLDEGSHVLVADNSTFVLLHTHYAFVNLDTEVALHLALASQTPIVLDLFASEVPLLRVEDFATALYYLAFALAT